MMNATKMRYDMKYENLQQGVFDSAGKYDIPIINKIEIDEIPELVSFNYAKSEKNRKDKGVHFFLDDYQFFRIWNTPCNYLDMLKNFKLVFSPDFSLYTDFPVALQIYNHYRKHWLGAFWQKMELMSYQLLGGVIPIHLNGVLMENLLGVRLQYLV